MTSELFLKVVSTISNLYKQV